VQNQIVPILPHHILHPSGYFSPKWVGKLYDNESDGLARSGAEAFSMNVGGIIQFFDRCQDALTCLFADIAAVIQHPRNSRGSDTSSPGDICDSSHKRTPESRTICQHQCGIDSSIPQKKSNVNTLSFTIGFFGLGLAAFLAYLIAVWRDSLPWYAGLGAALAVAAMSLLAGLNDLPLHKAGYNTTQDYTLFWLQRVFNLVYGVGFSAIPVFILWAGGRHLGKLVWPHQDKILPRSDDRWGGFSSCALT